MKNLLYLLLIGAGLNFVSCDDGAGPGGNATIEGLVMHHTRTIPNDSVYIKYNATQIPGNSPSNYDTFVMADSTGHYKFTGMKKGHYYLFGMGWDPTVATSQNPCIGGIAVTVSSSSSLIEVNVPISEDLY